MLKALRYRVQNFRNINDSDWIPLERVTTLVGRNESGKSALLKALHKFNPATPEPYYPQREFPRDRYTREFKNPKDWPVCSVEFEATGQFLAELGEIFGVKKPPSKVVCTRYYDDFLEIEFDPEVPDVPIEPKPIVDALGTLASAARRISAPPPPDAPAGQQPVTPQAMEEQTKELRATIAAWASGWQERLREIDDLRSEESLAQLTVLRTESENHANPQTATLIEGLQAEVDPVIAAAKEEPAEERAIAFVEENLPGLISVHPGSQWVAGANDGTTG